MRSNIFKLCAGVIFTLAWTTVVPTSLLAQTFTVLYSFTDAAHAAGPNGPLLLDTAGNLYGTTFGFDGAVFKLDTAGNLTVLHTFTGPPDGTMPLGGLVRDGKGNLYGTTFEGGSLCHGNNTGCGTVFKLDSTGTETVKRRFGGAKLGTFPNADLVLDAAGNLYGTTTQQNVVFKLHGGTYTVLHAFTGIPDGNTPEGGLIQDEDGNLYGSTSFGGTFGDGTVFKLNPAGNETILYNFTGGADGFQPRGDLVRDAEGNLYGATVFSNNFAAHGTIFKLDPNGHLTVLYTFPSGGAQGDYARGLVLDGKGNLYATTSNGINCACGSLFRLNMAGRRRTIHTFTGGTDGGGPTSGLTRDAAGNIYGTTAIGGDLTCSAPTGCGVIYKISW